MSLEIKIEVMNGGRPKKVVQTFEVEFEFDRPYKATIEKSINGKVEYDCVELTTHDGEEVEKEEHRYFIMETIENLLRKHGIGETTKTND